MANLTERDYQILDYIKKEINAKGYPPSVREICTAVGLSSTATVHARLAKLEKLGVIEKQSSKNRTIKIVDQSQRNDAPDSFETAPVLGRVTAGMPILAFEDNAGEYMPLPKDFSRGRELFVLDVSGDSMINAAILDGDQVIVEKTPTAENGEIVVALVNGEEATVKRFYKENGGYRLQPENDSMLPIIVDNVEILGRVVGVFRKL